MVKKTNQPIKDLDKYLGMWVAAKDDRVIAWGKTLTEVKRKIQTLRTKRIVIFQVPDVSKGHSFF